MSRVLLLGPQGERALLGAALDDAGVRGPVATITAGWQEWEANDDRLRHSLGRGSRDLGLYERAERVWRADPGLRAAHRAVQTDLKRLRRVYNRRLARAVDDLVDLSADGEPDDPLLTPERAHALDALRRLDAHHLERVADIQAAFEAEYQPRTRSAVAAVREQLARELDDVEALVVEGGHVAVLLNRLRLFGVAELLGDRLVVGVSGGAMALAERVVLFHDAPPWGPGHSEVALPGLGLHRGLVPLPHGRRRLKLDDPGRVARLSQRLAPARCVLLDADTRLLYDRGAWRPMGASRLTDDGAVERWEAAA